MIIRLDSLGERSKKRNFTLENSEKCSDDTQKTNYFVKPDEQHEARFKCCHGEKRCMLINSFLADISREVAVDALCAIVHQIETENPQTHFESTDITFINF